MSDSVVAPATPPRGPASTPSDVERTPWKADRDKDVHYVIDAEGDCVALVLEGRKTADLIAAAPEMLETLKAISPLLGRRGVNDDETWGAFSRVISTILKAEGLPTSSPRRRSRRHNQFWRQ